MENDRRIGELRTMKRRATALLVVVTMAFLALAFWAPGDATWAGFAVAGAEGSLVGGLADWFAVTALFRHPLGLPIPHTAVIRERKDQFGATLGEFVQENFLSPDVVSERVHASRPAARMAEWLTDEGHATTVARTVLDGAVAALELAGDDDVHRLLHDEIQRALQSVPFAPLAGRALRSAVADGRHQPVVDGLLRGAVTFLADQREGLRHRFGEASPWWLPGALEDRVFDRLVDGVSLLLDAVAADPDHELRATLDARLADLSDRLEHDPELAARADTLVADVVASADVRAWTRSLWDDLQRALRAEATDGHGEPVLRRRLAEAVVAIGHRLGDDLVLQARIEGAVETAVRYVAEHHAQEIAGLISATVSRWDADETSDKLELLLGRDLQFIRINGTVVGGLAGLVIHAVARLAG